MDKDNYPESNVNVTLIQKEFENLYNQWLEYTQKPDIRISSESEDYINCKPYKDIINLGRLVLPLLIQKMREGKASSWNEGEFLLWYAVKEISGVNLVKNDEIISEQEIAERYINWWKEQRP